MDDFTERMLERTQRRKELLASTLSLVPQPVLPPSSTMMETSPTIQQSLSPPFRRQRRTRLAELASQVDQWLSDDQNFKQNENISNSTKTIKINDNQNESKKSTILSPQYTITKDIIETNENKSTDTEQPKQKQYTNKLKQFREEQQSNNGPLPQKHSPNLPATTLTVAQRRALFEPNNTTQQQSKKPITTTTVTISLTKTTPATDITETSTTAAIKATEESEVDAIKTPPRPIPCSASTPPSRRGTRPRTSLGAAAASNNLTEQQRSVWTPPCIKNVLLKKKLINELEVGEQMPNNSSKDRVGKRSPFDKFNPDSIKYKPVSPSANLYPDLSLIADDEHEIKTLMTPLEIQSMACKRRSNGSSALNTSTASSESVPEDCDNAEILGAKRYRSQQKEKNPETIDVPALLEETSPSTPVTGINTTPGGGHCSMLSSLAGSPLSQACSSFIFHRGNESLNDNKSFSTSMEQRQSLEDQQCNAQANQLPESRLIDKYFEFVNSDGEEETVEPIPNNNVLSPNQSGSHSRLQFDSSKHIIDNVELDKYNSSSSSSSSSSIKPALIHTVSTYRKQQQQLRLNGANSSSEQQMKIPVVIKEEPGEDIDEEEMILLELEKVAERARDLEYTVVPEQDRIIEQATQALNICDVYRQKNTLRPVVSHQFSPEHVHAERLLLIAGLRRTDAIREAQRLRVERSLLPGGNMGERFTDLNACGDGKTLVIQSLRVPILSSLNSGGNHNKIKHNSNDGLENLTRWPGGYRYFVCAIRAVATVHRPPMTAASRPADAVEESVLRFSNDATTCRNKDETNYGYVEFITKKRVKNSGSRKCAGPTESDGAPIMIHGLDDRGWKITVELYGVSPTGTGENDHHSGGNNVKEHDVHENRSVLDKLWSTVTTPSKEPKKHHGSTATTCIESPSGPMAVRNTVFRQLGYFVFSDGQVDRKQFTLNKVHQSGCVPSNSRVTTNTVAEETVRIRMCLLEEGQQYEDDSDAINFDNKSLESNTYTASGSKAVWAQKPLKFPSECKRLEGFLTLFDDHELRSYNFIRESQWQRRTDIGDSTKGGTTSWRRLWFRAEIIDTNQKSINNIDKPQEQQNNINLMQQTIVLRYWKYPEYAEQEREPLGSIDLNCCLPPTPPEEETTTAALGQQQKHKQKPIPAAPALPDLCTRPNTLRLILYNVGDACDSFNDGNHGHDKTHEVLLLAADTADERRDWCETVNAAVIAIGEHREQSRLVLATQLKKKQYNNEKEQQQLRHQVEQRTGAWPTTPGGTRQYNSKKKKFYK